MKHRILIADDDESGRSGLAALLTMWGYEVQEAATAKEGLEAFADGNFDVVFTDFFLPDACGDQVARTVARRAPGTPVVLLTAHADQLDNDATRFEGVTCILGKPVAVTTLTATLARLCPPRERLGQSSR